MQPYAISEAYNLGLNHQDIGCDLFDYQHKITGQCKHYTSRFKGDSIQTYINFCDSIDEQEDGWKHYLYILEETAMPKTIEALIKQHNIEIVRENYKFSEQTIEPEPEPEEVKQEPEPEPVIIEPKVPVDKLATLTFNYNFTKQDEKTKIAVNIMEEKIKNIVNVDEILNMYYIKVEDLKILTKEDKAISTRIVEQLQKDGWFVFKSYDRRYCKYMTEDHDEGKREFLKNNLPKIIKKFEKITAKSDLYFYSNDLMKLVISDNQVQFRSLVEYLTKEYGAVRRDKKTLKIYCLSQESYNKLVNPNPKI